MALHTRFLHYFSRRHPVRVCWASCFYFCGVCVVSNSRWCLWAFGRVAVFRSTRMVATDVAWSEGAVQNVWDTGTSMAEAGVAYCDFKTSPVSVVWVVHVQPNYCMYRIPFFVSIWGNFCVLQGVDSSEIQGFGNSLQLSQELFNIIIVHCLLEVGSCM